MSTELIISGGLYLKLPGNLLTGILPGSSADDVDEGEVGIDRSHIKVSVSRLRNEGVVVL